MVSRDKLWSFPVRPEEVAEDGTHVDLAADAATRAAVAAAAGLLALPRLEAHFDLRREGRERLRVTGTLSASVVQACIVTLDPVENEVREEIDSVFVPPGAAAEAASDAAHWDAPDPPELLDGGAADLGALAVELLMLGLDPYPRKQGAAFAPVQPEPPRASPFSVLAALRPADKRSE